MKKKKVLALVLAIVMTAGLMMSCGITDDNTNASASSDEKSTVTDAEDSTASEENTGSVEEAGKTVVNVGIAASITDVSPWGPSDPGNISVISTAYQRLFCTSGVSSMDLIPVMGKRWEMISDDTVEVEIYDYIYDSDGNHFTADDVIYSFETAKRLSTRTDTAFIDSLEKIDDYTITMKLTSPGETNAKKLLYNINMVTQKAYEANQETPAGTSSYKLVSYTNGSEFVFEKVDNYWQTEELNAFDQQANVDKIIFSCIPESAQMTTALETGEIQMAADVTGREAKRFEEGGENHEGFTVDTVSGRIAWSLLFNDTDASLCNDINLRMAILHAINKEAIVAISMEGAAVEAKDIASKVITGYNPKWLEEEYFEFDLEKSAEYLSKSNYNGETLKIQSDAGHGNVLELIQAQLSEAGISSEINTYENALWQSLKVAGTGESEWDLCVDGNGGATVPNCWDVQFGSGTNVTGLPQNGSKDEKITELLTKAISTQDANDIDAFHYYIIENGYAEGLYANATKYVYVDTITDLCYNYMGYLIPGSCNYDNYTVTEQ